MLHEECVNFFNVHVHTQITHTLHVHVHTCKCTYSAEVGDRCSVGRYSYWRDDE